MTGIPLIRASQLLPFAAWLEDQAVPSAPLLRRVALPAEPEEAPDRLIAELPLWKFLETTAGSQGIVDFGLRVGVSSEIEEIGAFGRALRGQATLRRALDLFCRDVNWHSSHASFGLTVGDGAAWFWRRGFPGIESTQVEQYVLGLMLQIVRSVAGSAWVPDRIGLRAEGLPGPLAAGLFSESRVLGGSPVTAIRFHAEILARPLRAQQNPVSALGGPPIPGEDLVASLRQALDAALSGGAPGLEWAAKAANTSPRTLRRRLLDAGLTWFALVEQVRFDRARRLLQTTDLKLIDVAREVGYTDQANFTRAFRRWTGAAPSRFRPKA